MTAFREGDPAKISNIVEAEINEEFFSKILESERESIIYPMQTTPELTDDPTKEIKSEYAAEFINIYFNPYNKHERKNGMYPYLKKWREKTAASLARKKDRRVEGHSEIVSSLGMVDVVEWFENKMANIRQKDSQHSTGPIEKNFELNSHLQIWPEIEFGVNQERQELV